jgi:predicted  nucleic acid-binding Zn-ribbon protein
LWNYVYVLNSEIDLIEEQNKNIEAEIKYHEEKHTMSSSDKEKVREQLVKRSEEMKAAIDQREAQIKFIEQQMAAITKYVQQMVTLFCKSSFYQLQSVSSH